LLRKAEHIEVEENAAPPGRTTVYDRDAVTFEIEDDGR
jgi:hypothetical protein